MRTLMCKWPPACCPYCVYTYNNFASACNYNRATSSSINTLWLCKYHGCCKPVFTTPCIWQNQYRSEINPALFIYLLSLFSVTILILHDNPLSAHSSTLLRYFTWLRRKKKKRKRINRHSLARFLPQRDDIWPLLFGEFWWLGGIMETNEGLRGRRQIHILLCPAPCGTPAPLMCLINLGQAAGIISASSAGDKIAMPLLISCMQTMLTT